MQSGQNKIGWNEHVMNLTVILCMHFFIHTYASISEWGPLFVLLPDDAVAGSTQRCAAAGCEPLRPLSHTPCHGSKRSRARCHVGWTWSYRCCRGRVGDVSWRRRCSLGQRLYGCGHLAGVILVGKVGVSHPGGSVAGGGCSWSRSWGSSWGAGLWRSRGWSWRRMKNEQPAVSQEVKSLPFRELSCIWMRFVFLTWLRGVDAGGADHLWRGSAKRNLNGALLSGRGLLHRGLLILLWHWLVLLRGRDMWRLMHGWRLSIHARKRCNTSLFTSSSCT